MSEGLEKLTILARDAINAKWDLHDEVRKLRAQIEDEKEYLGYLLSHGWLKDEVEPFVRNRLEQLEEDWPTTQKEEA